MPYKIAIVIVTDTSQADGLGRVANGLTAAKMLKDAKANVQVIFSGAGTKWIGEIAKPDHTLYSIYTDLKDSIVGACSFCACVFDVPNVGQDSDLNLLEEYGTPINFYHLVQNGYQVLTF